jgi:anaerobic C4-dicarboxylate transporter
MMKMEMEKLNENVERALEQKPSVRVPDSFAARVAAQAAAQSLSAPLKPRERRLAMSRVAAMIAMAVCAVVLFAVAPKVGSTYTGWPFAIEMLALVQMAGIAWGLAAKGLRIRD